MKLYITRHAQTEENEKGILQGQMPGRLSQKGREQAQKIAKRLKNEDIDLIFSSDLQRSLETAKEIAKFHPGVKLEPVKELRERDLGNLQGKKISEVDWETKQTDDSYIKKMNGESLEDLYNRAKNFINKIFQKHYHSSILCAGHDGINKAIISVILGKGPDEIHKLEDQHNASINLVEISKNHRPKIQKLNNIDHLK